jgi:hypothetical protein
MSTCRHRRCRYQNGLYQGYCGKHWIIREFPGLRAGLRTRIALWIAPWLERLAP